MSNFNAILKGLRRRAKPNEKVYIIDSEMWVDGVDDNEKQFYFNYALHLLPGDLLVTRKGTLHAVVR
jgi:hypothetical protein